MAATMGEAITAAATTVAVAVGTTNRPAGRPGVTVFFWPRHAAAV
jgi:hypothetical protein